jgi:hypothetical protein
MGPVDYTETRHMKAHDESSSDVYITGQMDSDFGTSLIATWRYDSSGSLASGWPKTWPSSSDGQCYGVAAVPVYSGEVFVVGAYTIDGWGLNTVVLRYQDDGDLLVAAEFDILGECGGNYPVAAAYDGAGGLWVACASIGCAGSAFSYDYLFWSVDVETGATIDTARFDGSGFGDFLAEIKAVTVPLAEYGGASVTVIAATGRSFTTSTLNDIQTVKYYLLNGSLLDKTAQLPNGGRFNASGFSTDIGTSLALAQSSNGGTNNFVSGHTRASSNDDFDYVILGYLWDNVAEDHDIWSDVRDGTGGDDVTAKIIFAGDNNNEGRVVVTGTSWGGSTNFDSWTLSYPIDGDTGDLRAWRSPLTSEDRAIDIDGLDGGDVYIIGRVYNGSNYDYRTVRLNSTAAAWDAIWPNDAVVYDVGSGSDFPAAIRIRGAFDQFGNDVSDVYVTGRNAGPFDSGYRYATVRYVQTSP